MFLRSGSSTGRSGFTPSGKSDTPFGPIDLSNRYAKYFPTRKRKVRILDCPPGTGLPNQQRLIVRFQRRRHRFCGPEVSPSTSTIVVP